MLVCPSDCQHDHAIQSVSAPPCAMGGEAGRHNKQNTRYHVGPSRGRHVLSIAVNSEDHKSIAMRRDYSSHAAQH